MLAESLDAQELDDFHAYLLAGGDKNKWRWSSPDKAGTAGSSENAPKDSLLGMKELLKRKGGAVLSGSGIEFARATGRPIILMNPDGVYFDESVEIVQPPFRPDTIIVKVDYDGNPING